MDPEPDDQTPEKRMGTLKKKRKVEVISTGLKLFSSWNSLKKRVDPATIFAPVISSTI
jgi:hypothetical protein